MWPTLYSMPTAETSRSLCPPWQVRVEMAVARLRLARYSLPQFFIINHECFHAGATPCAIRPTPAALATGQPPPSEHNSPRSAIG